MSEQLDTLSAQGNTFQSGHGDGFEGGATPALTSRGLDASQPVQPVGGGTKRLADLLISAGAILILAPLLLVLFVLIRLESSGPAIFVQKRGGFGGRAFSIFKFRTMTTFADGGPLEQTKRNDMRFTRLGAVLRKTSLDELPQLFNVLKGDMSIVGPRPHPVDLDRQCILLEPAYQARQAGRPGMTGLAQVSGSRGPLTTPEEIRERLRFDLAYLRTWSLRSDLSIVVRTAATVLKDSKAF